VFEHAWQCYVNSCCNYCATGAFVCAVCCGSAVCFWLKYHHSLKWLKVYLLASTMPVKMSAAKAAATATSKPKKCVLKDASKDKAAELGVTMGDVSNFLVQLAKTKAGVAGNPEDAAKTGTLALYKSLGRFDEEKKALVAKWKLDKSCKWFSEYTHSREKENAVSTEALLGFGTRHLTLIYVLLLLCISYQRGNLWLLLHL
jgi:hypothetical protein